MPFPPLRPVALPLHLTSVYRDMLISINLVLIHWGWGGGDWGAVLVLVVPVLPLVNGLSWTEARWSKKKRGGHFLTDRHSAPRELLMLSRCGLAVVALSNYPH